MTAASRRNRNSALALDVRLSFLLFAGALHVDFDRHEAERLDPRRAARVRRLAERGLLRELLDVDVVRGDDGADGGEDPQDCAPQPVGEYEDQHEDGPEGQHVDGASKR